MKQPPRKTSKDDENRKRSPVSRTQLTIEKQIRAAHKVLNQLTKNKVEQKKSKKKARKKSNYLLLWCLQVQCLVPTHSSSSSNCMPRSRIYIRCKASIRGPLWKLFSPEVEHFSGLGEEEKTLEISNKKGNSRSFRLACLGASMTTQSIDCQILKSLIVCHQTALKKRDVTEIRLMNDCKRLSCFTAKLRFQRTIPCRAAASIAKAVRIKTRESSYTFENELFYRNEP